MNWKTGMLFLLALGLCAGLVVGVAVWNGKRAEGVFPGVSLEDQAWIQIEVNERFSEERRQARPESSAERLEFVVRPGPLVVMPEGAVLDPATFGKEARAVHAEWRERGVTLRPETGVTVVELAELIDVLLDSLVSNISFAGEAYEALKAGR